MSRSSVMWLLAATTMGGLVLAACSGDDAVTTEAPVAAATVETTATAPSEPLEPTPTTAPTPAPAVAELPAENPVSYTDEGIHRILENSCATCHGEGGPGSPAMTLAQAGDAQLYADEIALATQAGVMPPWPASDLSVAFVGDHSLTAAEIDSITRWADNGGTIDVDPSTAIVATKPVPRIEDPDMTLTSATGAYTGSPDVVDDYRCLIFDPQVSDTEWILASHFEPDQEEVVHHGIITLASGELRGQADLLDAAEPGPGWTCYSGTRLNAGNGGYEFRMGGWAPGAQPARQPEGYAIPLRPGDFLVVQVHYHFDDTAPADLSRMVFDLASAEDLAAVGGQYKALQGALYLGPAEIPCYAGDPHLLCDRDMALKRVQDLYGRFSAALPDYFLSQCNSRPEDYAAMTDGTAWSTCDLPVQNPGRIVSLTGHMHELGKSIRLTLNPGEPDEQILLDIPNWNFEWQFGYQPVDEIVIDRDDTIRIDCAWNRERAPYEAVGYILWADGTGDEMCFSSITTAPP